MMNDIIDGLKSVLRNINGVTGIDCISDERLVNVRSIINLMLALINEKIIPDKTDKPPKIEGQGQQLQESKSIVTTPPESVAQPLKPQRKKYERTVETKRDLILNYLKTMPDGDYTIKQLYHACKGLCHNGNYFRRAMQLLSDKMSELGIKVFNYGSGNMTHYIKGNNKSSEPEILESVPEEVITLPPARATTEHEDNLEDIGPTEYFNKHKQADNEVLKQFNNQLLALEPGEVYDIKKFCYENGVATDNKDKTYKLMRGLVEQLIDSGSIRALSNYKLAKGDFKKK
jgi:hypothetical protein